MKLAKHFTFGLKFSSTMQTIAPEDMWEREKRKKLVEVLRAVESMLDSTDGEIANVEIHWTEDGGEGWANGQWDAHIFVAEEKDGD